MDQLRRILLVVGTFLPVLGVILTVCLGVVLQRRRRAAALVLTPLLTYGLCDYFAGPIAANGNLLFVALLGVYMVALCIYYPVLLIAGSVIYCRKYR